MDNLTPQQRQKNMKRIKCKDTAIELALRKALWKEDIVIGKIIKDFQAIRILFLQNTK